MNIDKVLTELDDLIFEIKVHFTNSSLSHFDEHIWIKNSKNMLSNYYSLLDELLDYFYTSKFGAKSSHHDEEFLVRTKLVKTILREFDIVKDLQRQVDPTTFLLFRRRLNFDKIARTANKLLRVHRIMIYQIMKAS